MQKEEIDFYKPYEFKDNIDADIRSLIHCINFLGHDLIGLELGVAQGNSFMTILHNCPNVKTLYGIDSYKPYIDYIKPVYDETPAFVMDQKEIDFWKLKAKHRFQHSGMSEKIVFYEMDSDIALKKFEPESLDFIFVDAHLTYEQLKNDLKSWYPIIKKGGLFAGHDWWCDAVQKSVVEFRLENDINNIMSIYDGCFVWIK